MNDDKQTASNDGQTASVDGQQHPASDFAHAPAGSNPSEWKLPIFDAAHTRNALARFNQTQLPSGRAAAWKRILAAADRFNIDVSDRTMPGHNSASLWTKVAELLGKRSEPKAMTWEEHEALRTERQLVGFQLTPSESERSQMLKEALQEEYGDNGREVIVSDVYTAPKQCVIFWFQTPMGAQPKGQEFYLQEWADADNDGIPELTGDYMLVRKQTTYEPVGSGPAGDGAGAAGSYNAEKKEEPAPTVVEELDSAELIGAVANLEAATEKLSQVL